ncbi:MAG: MFS transporter [Chloroflexi bacterium]|nr:MFS transporter [Chloroflexota bacterium]
MSTMKSQLPPLRLPGRLYYGWVILGVAFLVNFASSPMNAVVVSFFVLPIGEEMGWSRSTIAWALTIRMITGGIVGPLLGPLVDRHGTRWLGVFTGVIAGGTVVSLYFVNGLWMLYALFAVSGLTGFGGPGGALLTGVPVSKWFIAKRGRAMAIATSGMALGTFIAVPIAQYLIQTFGWRWAWVAFGLVMWALIVPFYGLFMRREPEDMGLQPDGISEQSSKGRTGISPASEVNWTLGQASRTPVLWAILITQAGKQFASSAVLLHRVAFFQGEGISPATIAFGIALDPLLVIFTALFFGIVAERIAIRYIGVMGAFFWGLSILPMLFYVSGHSYFILLHSIIWAIGTGAGINFQNLIWPAYFGRKSLGAIRGVMLPLSIGAGALGAPLMGYVIDGGGGYMVAFALSLGLFLGPGVIYLFTKPPKPLPEMAQETTVLGTRSH